MRRARPLGGKPDDEALHVAPQPQQQPLARQVDRRDLQAAPGVDRDERVGRQPVDGLMHRRAPEADELLQVLQCKEAPGLSSQVTSFSSIAS